MNTSTTNRSETNSKKPDWKVRLGVLNLSCWKTPVQVEKGDRDFLTFTIQRSFRDKVGNWQNTQSLRKQDLLPMARLLERAFDKASTKPEE